MMIGIADQCINRWPSILPQFGISPSYLTGKQTPCPTCGGKDRFRFDNKDGRGTRSEEHTSELQSLMRSSYAAFCLTKKTNPTRLSRRQRDPINYQTIEDNATSNTEPRPHHTPTPPLNTIN